MTSSTALGNKVDDLQLTDEEEKLIAMSPTTAEKIFAFVKSKQEILASATEDKLNKLKEELSVSKSITTTGATNTYIA